MHACLCVCRFCCVRLFVTLWTVACQVPLSMGFTRLEYWSGLPCWDLADPLIESASLTLTGVAKDSLLAAGVVV